MKAASMHEATKPHADMSDYEAAAWAALINSVGRRDQRRRLKPVKKVEELAEKVLGRVETILDDHEKLAAIAGGLGEPLTGLQDLLQRAATASISDKRLLRKAAKRDASIVRFADIWKVDLEVPDRLLAHQTVINSAGMAAEGVGSRALVTGALLSSTIIGASSFAIIAAAVSTDVAANLAVGSRVVAKTAKAYGYDTNLPDERLFMFGVLSYGSTFRRR